MGRIFTFGCSFTDYYWATWADIILYKNEGVNLGLSGGGFDSILYSILEADRKYVFNSDDKIIVIFTTPIRWDLIMSRTDHFVWDGRGQVITSDHSKYLNELYCIDGLLFKSYYNIFLINNYLKNRGLNFIFGSVNDIFSNIGNYFEIFEINDKTIKLIDFVSKEVNIDLTNFHYFLYPDFYKKSLINSVNLQWKTTKTWKNNLFDYHPRPKDHYRWVNEILLKHLDIKINVTEELITRVENTLDKLTICNQPLENIIEDDLLYFLGHNKEKNVYL